MKYWHQKKKKIRNEIGDLDDDDDDEDNDDDIIIKDDSSTAYIVKFVVKPPPQPYNLYIHVAGILVCRMHLNQVQLLCTIKRYGKII